MNNKLFLLASIMMIFASCVKDNIIKTDQTATESDTETYSVDDVKFDRKVTIVLNGSSATISNPGSNLEVSESGCHITITNNGDEKVIYHVSGTTTDGHIKIYSAKKQCIILDGAEITNPRGAAINIQGPATELSKGKKTYIVSRGNNSLADGGAYSDTPADEDEKGVIFSEGTLFFSGDGTLTVTATGKSGIVSDDWICFVDSTTLNINSSAGHGVKANDSIVVMGCTINVTSTADSKKGFITDNLCRICGGNTTINVTGGAAIEDGDTTGTAGIKVDLGFIMSGGILTINNSGSGGKGISGEGTGTFDGGTLRIEVTGSNFGVSSGGGWWPGGGPGPGGMHGSTGGVKAKGIKFNGDLVINGGDIMVRSASSEGIESKATIIINGGEIYSYSSDDAINSASDMTINNGMVYAHGTDNDGLDANGNLYINGGGVYAIGAKDPEVAIDAAEQYKLYFNGGTVVGIGGFERGFLSEATAYRASSWTANTWYTLTDGDNTYAFKTPSSAGNKLAIYGENITPSTALKKGVTVSGGTSHFEGMFNIGGTYDGGTSVSLTTYTGNSW